MGIILPNLGFVLIKNIPEYEGGMVQGFKNTPLNSPLHRSLHH